MKKSVITLSIAFMMMFQSPATAQVDYESEIQPIFNQNCTSCHGSNSGVTLSSYDAVINSVGNQYGTEIVVPGSPNESPLVDKIEPSPDFGSRMPQGGPYLSEEQITLIRTWIEEGANEVPVSNERLAGIPQGFEIIGNYPNPFNPNTVVTFNAPEKASYSLFVYNAAGMLVREIAGISATPKTNVHLNMEQLPSGTYIYHLKIKTATKTFYLQPGKMTLVK